MTEEFQRPRPPHDIAFARALIFFGLIFWLTYAPGRIYAQPSAHSNSIIGEGSAGVCFGEAFGGGTANIGIVFERHGLRYSARYVHQADSRAPELSPVQPSKIDVMREASILIGLVYYDGAGVYSGNAGLGWTWGNYLFPPSSSTFGSASFCLEAYGGVELAKALRVGLHARANINGVRSTGAINATIGVHFN